MKQPVKERRESLECEDQHRRPSKKHWFSLEYKWAALSCTSIGALLAAINGGSLIVALPTLMQELNTSLFSLI